MRSNILLRSNITKFINLTICLLLGLYFSLIPLPGWLSTIRPDFFALILVYLLIQDPPMLSLSVIFFMGIFIDVLFAYPLGIHSLVFIILFYMVLKSYRQLRLFPIWQQAAYIASMVSLCNIVIFTIFSFITSNGKILYILMSWFSAFLVWPWLKLFFNRVFHNQVIG